jgi:hypothetical protein
MKNTTIIDTSNNNAAVRYTFTNTEFNKQLALMSSVDSQSTRSQIL